MIAVKAKEAEKAQFLKESEKIVLSSVGSYVSSTGADAVIKWLNEKTSSCVWFHVEDYAFAAYDPSESRIVFLGVKENHRREKAGTALLDAAVQMAEENHQSRICANAIGDAIPFYEAYGFETTDEVTEGGGLRYAPMEYLLGRTYLGKTVKVIVDRPYGSLHPHIADLEYELNFGYVLDPESLDGEMQDAWVYGVHEPVDTFTGHVVAVIYHLNGSSRLVVARIGEQFTKEQVIAAVGFEEQYYDTRIIWASSIN